MTTANDAAIMTMAMPKSMMRSFSFSCMDAATADNAKG